MDREDDEAATVKPFYFCDDRVDDPLQAARMRERRMQTALRQARGRLFNGRHWWGGRDGDGTLPPTP